MLRGRARSTTLYSMQRAGSPVLERPRLERRARRLVGVTITWGLIGAVVAVGAGIVARSVALVGFGVDSSIEVLAALVVVWHLRGVDRRREQRALRFIAICFMALATYVLVQAIPHLSSNSDAKTSPAGIGVAVASALVMAVLAVTKRRTGYALGSRAIIADAAVTKLCAYLSVVLLVGLVLDAAFAWEWADPVAAFGIAMLALRLGRESWPGDEVGERT